MNAMLLACLRIFIDRMMTADQEKLKGLLPFTDIFFAYALNEEEFVLFQKSSRNCCDGPQ